MIRIWRFCLALFMALPPQAAMAADIVLEPSDKWVLNYANDSCRLARTFGKGKDEVLLVLDQFQPDSMIDLTLVGKRFGRFGAPTIPLSATFGPALNAGEPRDAILGTLGPAKTAIVMAGPRDILNRPIGGKGEESSDDVLRANPQQEAAITELHITASSMRLTLHTNSMGAPLAAMRKCISNLVRDWSLDPAQQDALSKRVQPLAKPGYWLRSSDYPVGALAMGENAIVRFRLMVGADGSPTQCFVQQATMSPEFIKLTCDLLMRRARFSPAHDHEGKPVASYYANSVRWMAS